MIQYVLGWLLRTDAMELAWYAGAVAWACVAVFRGER